MLLSQQTISKHVSDIGVTDVKRVGIGWSGIVYQGYYKGLPVAVKYTLSRIGQSHINANSSIAVNIDTYGITNMNEIYVMTQINHSHIMSATKVFTYADYKYLCGSIIIMKYVPNTLTEYALKIPIDVKIKIIVKLIHAISYLHKHNITHGDIRSSNILIEDNEPFLTDFGASRIRSSDFGEDIKLFGQLMLYIFTGQNTYTILHQVNSRSLDNYNTVTRKIISEIGYDNVSDGTNDSCSSHNNAIRDLLESTLINCEYVSIDQLLTHKIFGSSQIDIKIKTFDIVSRECSLLKLLARVFEYQGDEKRLLPELITLSQQLYYANLQSQTDDTPLAIGCFWAAAKMVIYPRLPFKVISNCLSRLDISSKINVSQLEANIILRLKNSGR